MFDKVLDSFQKNGYAVIKNALNKDALAVLREKSKQEFLSLDKIESELTPEHSRLLNRGETPILDAKSSTRTSLNIFEIVADSDIPKIIRTLVDGEFLWHYPSQFRRINPKNTKTVLPYHQDCFYNDRYKNIIVVFIPLNNCGVNSPSLEIVELKMDTVLGHTDSPTWEFGTSEDELVRVMAKQRSVSLKFNLGDVAIFDGLTLHRTFCNEHMDIERFSVDIRAVKTCFIDDDLLKSRKYITPNGIFN